MESRVTLAERWVAHDGYLGRVSAAIFMARCSDIFSLILNIETLTVLFYPLNSVGYTYSATQLFSYGRTP